MKEKQKIGMLVTGLTGLFVVGLLAKKVFDQNREAKTLVDMLGTMIEAYEEIMEGGQ